MTISPHDAPLLLTEDDVVELLDQLVGAQSTRTLWLLMVDGDRRQAPVLIPIEGVPERPGDALDGLQHVLEQTVPQLATDTGPGSVIFALERRGPSDITPADRAWGDGLRAMCDRAGVELRGVYASAGDGVRPVR